MSLSRLIDYSENETLAAQVFDPPKPGPDARSSILWAACQEIAQAALNSDFMQELGRGTLDPTTYGQYTVQDCAYCASAADDYKMVHELATAAEEKNLAKIAETHYTSYESWVVNTYLPDWHIGNPDALVLNEAGKEYIDHERAACTTLHPIYGVLAQLPCERLWPWLAEQLKPGSPSGNVYHFWIKENYDYKTSFLLSNTIDQHFNKHPDQYDDAVALWVLKGSVTGEANMFLTACGQPLLPMPKLPEGTPTS